MERYFAWAGGRTLLCVDDVLLSYTLETCMVLSKLIASVSP